ncbi:TetR/AcrR family transcriptional regulator [uncultured Agrococcus sp.]|uniref:TetR/AcrR family transcriptional regulator n=1 Tax=uncultured Agrococcus sp. TaxID=382258 RepID=UPI0025EB3B6E|nr:TetR/AcrR family transcriptional regulator [uncultured Agrococcus sp.]
MSRPSRRDDVLRAAETVFADKGYDRATMRNIAQEAGVGLPLVVYHFETKLKLYRAIFEEYQHWNDARLDALRSVQLSAADALEQIVAAFLLVGTRRPLDDRTSNYLRLVLREASDPHAPERKIIEELFDPMAREFIRALEVVLPQKPEGFHRWAYLFAVGAFTSTNVGERERALADDAPDSGERLVFLQSFICAGIRHG